VCEGVVVGVLVFVGDGVWLGVWLGVVPLAVGEGLAVSVAVGEGLVVPDGEGDGLSVPSGVRVGPALLPPEDELPEDEEQLPGGMQSSTTVAVCIALSG
jgi:hypothetical protein